MWRLERQSLSAADPCSAVILELGGVIADLRAVQSRVESAILARYDIRLRADELRALQLRAPDVDLLRQVLQQRGVRADSSAIAAEKWSRVAHEIAGSPVAARGAENLINRLRRRGYALGVVSGAPRFLIEDLLGWVGLRGAFAAAVSAEEVEHGRPAPDIFIETARRLIAAPCSCAVVENSAAGVSAANMAGAKSIFLDCDRTTNVPVDLKVQTLSEITDQTFAELFRPSPPVSNRIDALAEYCLGRA